MAHQLSPPILVLVSVALLSSNVACASSETALVSQVEQAPTTTASSQPPRAIRQRAKNVILFIGDGVDDHQLSIARAYLYGLDGSFSFDQFPHRAQARVRTVSEEDGETPVYVADSASSGTALASGILTSRGRIGTTAKTDRDVPTFLELAKTRGLATGIVTTAAITDATPASFMAHTNVRFCQGPADMNGTSDGLPGCPRDTRARGGAGSIAEQIADKDVDVLLGGGSRYFSQRVEEGEVLVELMQRRGYHLVNDRKELASVAPDTQRRVLGLFGSSTLPTEWHGVGGRSSAPVSLDGEEPVYPSPFSCEANPRFGDRPTLVAMTRAAIEILSARAGNDGFFLMVESASIDKQAHAMNPCGQIGETLALSDSVQVAAEFAELEGDTLVIVTSDHGHAPQIIPYPSLFTTFAPDSKIPMYPPGRVALLQPAAGGILAVSYGTNARYIEEHTGTTVPAFAMGPGAHNVRGLIDQADIFEFMVQALGD